MNWPCRPEAQVRAFEKDCAKKRSIGDHGVEEPKNAKGTAGSEGGCRVSDDRLVAARPRRSLS